MEVQSTTVNGFGTIVQLTRFDRLWDTIAELSVGVAEWRIRRVTEFQRCRAAEVQSLRVTGLQSCGMAELQSHRGGELHNKGIAGLRRCGVKELQSYRVTVLGSCRVGEPQRYIHGLALQGCIKTK